MNFVSVGDDFRLNTHAGGFVVAGLPEKLLHSGIKLFERFALHAAGNIQQQYYRATWRGIRDVEISIFRITHFFFLLEVVGRIARC